MRGCAWWTTILAAAAAGVGGSTVRRVHAMGGTPTDDLVWGLLDPFLTCVCFFADGVCVGPLVGAAVCRVKLAVHEESGEECAIKVMDKSKIHASAMTLHVRREIAIMKTLNHPYVIRLHAVLNSSSKLYLVMDLVKGGELFHKIVREGYLSEAEGRKHFQQLVDGVSYCHSMDVCHRDLKVRAPVVVGREGGRGGKVEAGSVERMYFELLCSSRLLASSGCACILIPVPCCPLSM